MTDEQIYQNEEQFLEEQQDVELSEDVKPIINVREAIESDQNDVSMEDSTSEETPACESNVDKNVNDSNNSDDANVESPSTVDNFVFKCIFCDRVLTANDDPKLLECLHNACGSCVESKLYEENTNGNKVLKCTSCGLACSANNIIQNQFLLDQTNVEESGTKLSELKCSSCSDDATATSWCVDCSEFICDNCVQAHQRLKITKDHTIKAKEEGMQENQSNSNSSFPNNLYCSIHPHEKLSLFCEHCDKLTCRDCQLIEHRDHKYKFTHEIASDTRIFISSILKDICYKRVLLNSATKVISDRQSLINERKQALVKEITQVVVRLTNTINVRGKQLVTKVNEVCEAKQKTLEEKKLGLKEISKMTDHCIEFIQHALDNGTDMALLYSKKHVTDHLQRVKCKRADIPNPEIPVRINLVFEKMPELIKGVTSVLSNIGQIVVDGRVYPSQSTSPSLALTPQNSPSPGHTSTPQQQQSPLSQALQQPSPTNYQQPRMMPPYGQQFNQNMGVVNQNMQHNMNQHNLNQHNIQSNNINQQPMLPIMNQSNINQQNKQQNMPSNINMQPNVNQNVQQNSSMSPNMNQNMQQNLNQNMQSNMGQKTHPPGVGPGMSLPPPAIPISLAQYQQKVHLLGLPQMQRPPIPIMPMNNRMHNAGKNNQQQVTSSTHPHSMMQDISNLRGLLQPNNNNTVYVQTGPSQYQAVQPQFAQQFQNRYQNHMQLRPQIRMAPTNQQLRMAIQRQNTANMKQHHNIPTSVQHQQGAKWHIPQQNHENLVNANVNNRTAPSLPSLNENFKITLKPQTSTELRNNAAVTSTIPKTPSPNHIQGNTERSLDKFCEESVKDLMATIAKLDSNGVQVLAENRTKTGGSPHVDSSTGDIGSSVKNKNDMSETGKDDPNEDWCAVCMDGGELVCCDKCPKVFHQFCHIPNLRVEENDTWQCLLCMNFADIPDNVLGEKRDGEMSLKEKKIAERIVLELYCQYEPSLPFREVIGPDNIDYHSIIKKPIALDTIRQKLDWNSSSHYTDLEHLVRDVRQMFKNAYTYNAVESVVYNDAKTLEKFFDEQLEKWLPEYAYETFDEDNIQPPNKKYRRIICD